MSLKALRNQSEAIVEAPTDEQAEFCKEAVCNRHPSLTNVHCFCDGLKLEFESCGDLTEQGMHHNGWTHGHCITNLFVFDSTGRIMDCVINVPGSIHDSTLAVWGGTHKRLKKTHERTGGICAVDSAFAANNAPCLIRSSQDHHKAKSNAELRRMTEVTSLDKLLNGE